MIGRLIELSARNSVMVLLIALMLVGLGVWSVANTPLDALPDLSRAVQRCWMGCTEAALLHTRGEVGV